MAENDQDAPPAAEQSAQRFATLAPISPKVDIVTFRTYISEKMPDYKCPTCQNRSFGVMGFTGENMPSELALFVSNRHQNLGHNVYTFFGIVCQNCGNSQFFFSELVEDWARGRAQAAEPQE